MRRAGVFLLVATVVGGAILWFMFQHKPDWYQPVHLDPIAKKQARRDATNFIDSIGDRMVKGDPFDLVLNENRLNEWLGMMPEFASGVSVDGSGLLTLPAIRFTEDRMQLGAHYQKGGLRAILGLTIVFAVGSDDESVRMTVESIHGGSLPVPRRILDPLIESAIQKTRDSSRSGVHDPSLAGELLEHVESVDDLFEGVVRRNRFVWPNGRRLFMFESIEILEGEMRLRIKPL